MLNRIRCLLIALTVSMVGSSAQAVSYGFRNISANSVANALVGEAQLFVDVTDLGSGKAAFTFTNIGPVASSITDVYFDGTALSSLHLITNGSGVSFSDGASPPNLPSGSPAGFFADFAMDSNSPVSANGVNPGEMLTVAFNLSGGVAFHDLLDQLDTADLRIGIHLQSINNGGSEAFINENKQVPAPGAALLASLGLAVIAWKKRRMPESG